MTWIKLCGMVRPVDFEFAVGYEIDAVGIIAVPNTPRCVSIDEARMLGNLPREKTKLVLVLEDPEGNYAREMIETANPDLLQFHGSETPQFCEQFEIPYLKATRDVSIKGFEKLEKHKNAFAFLLDSKEMKSKLVNLLKNFVLAGELTTANVSEKIKSVRPWGVDVSRGIEEEPRKKDFELMKNFVNAVRTTKA